MSYASSQSSTDTRDRVRMDLLVFTSSSLLCREPLPKGYAHVRRPVMNVTTHSSSSVIMNVSHSKSMNLYPTRGSWKCGEVMFDDGTAGLSGVVLSLCSRLGPNTSAAPSSTANGSKLVPLSRRLCRRAVGGLRAALIPSSSLVDPASSHMLVSKIKPCMSQCKPN